MLAYLDLREFIAELEKMGLLKRISLEVDCELEITEIVDRVSKLPENKNVALLFKNVKGHSIPVLINAFGSMERMAAALGVREVDDIAKDIRELLRLPFISLQNKLDLLRIIPKAKKAVNFPRYVRTGPCKDVIIKDQPSLDKFPILRCWPKDAGKFITLPLLFTKNPVNGKRNVGMYRMQVFYQCTTGMHWHIHKNGAENFRAAQKAKAGRLEVAVALGGDPVLTMRQLPRCQKILTRWCLPGFCAANLLNL